jgi:ankyrin repeat protein
MFHCEDDGGRSALMLLEAGASLDSFDRDSLCTFASESTVAIRLLIDHGVVVREIVASDGSTPLHAAACNTRDAEVFELLVNAGIDLEARSLDGSTCILFAVEFNNDVALRCLIKAGADVNVAAIGNATPLHRVDNYDCAVLLLAGGASVRALDEQ